jgi:putative tributyrin esterase
MAFIQCGFRSRVLDLAASMNVVLPQRDDLADRRPFPWLLLLHGLSDDHATWSRRTSVERYAEARGIAVVMPAGGRGFYVDNAEGPRWGAFIAEEVPAVARAFFPLSDRREDTYIAGLSMGGYGALRIALAHPDRFAAAGSFSGGLDMSRRPTQLDPSWARELARVFGDLDALPGSANDVFELAIRLNPADRRRLRLFQCCGTEDFLYDGNVRFRDHARSLGLDLTYEEGPGTHEWGYWDAAVRRFLDWLPAPGAAGRT